MDDSYLTDITYTGEFFDHLTPAWMAYVAAINGYVSTPLTGQFTWCELGCGKGVTALILAAMHPEGEFHACDFNPAHIAYAERLRVEAGLQNLHFHTKTFEEMRNADLPSFDFVAIHGVYSWVPEEGRREIRAFLRDKLKPAGLATVSYNAMPGWAHLQPLRKIMRDYAESLTQGTSLERVREAFAFLDFLAKNNAGYFATHPAAVAHLREIATQDIRYVVHEYLTPHGDPFYFSDVEKDMRASGLVFAGNMTVAENYVEIMAQRPFQKMLTSAASRTVRELRRDFIVNTRFRRDLYSAQPESAAADSVPLARFAGIAFCLGASTEMLPMKAAAGQVDLGLQARAVSIQKVHALLADGRASAQAIHAAAGCTEQEASLLIQHLVIARHLVPCPPTAPRLGWPALNTVLVDVGLAEELLQIPLACPLSATAVYIDVVFGAIAEAAANNDDAAAAARSVLSRVRKHGHPVNKTESDGTKRVASDDEVLEYAQIAWRELRDTKFQSARMMRVYGLLT
jgi:predicted O-methyltransferase YrrM